MRKLLLTLVLLAASPLASAQTYSFDGFVVGTNGKLSKKNPEVSGDVTFAFSGGQESFSEVVYEGTKMLYSSSPEAFASYASVIPGTETFYEFTPTFYAPFHGSFLTTFASVSPDGQVTIDNFGPFGGEVGLDSFTRNGKTTGVYITSFSLVPAVPEPSTDLAMLVGLGLMGYAYRRSHRRSMLRATGAST